MGVNRMSFSLLVFVRSLIAFAALFLFARIIRKQQIGQMTLFEYLTGITIGSIAASLSVELEDEPVPTLVGIATWGGITLGIAVVSLRSQRLRRFFETEPRVLIRDGRIIEENLRKERMTMDQLLMNLRLKNVFRVEDVAYAILEANGQVSVLPKADKRPLQPHDLNLPVSAESLPFTVIKDGQINHQRLAEAGRTTTWLMGELKRQGIDRVEDVSLAQLDDQGKLFVDRKGEWEEGAYPSGKQLVANLEKLLVDLHQFALETDDPRARRDYRRAAQHVETILGRLKRHFRERRRRDNVRLRLLALALLGCLGLGLAAGCANPFKAPLSPEQDVLGAARATLRAVEEGQWATADEQYGRLVAAWRAIHRRVYLTPTRETSAPSRKPCPNCAPTCATGNKPMLWPRSIGWKRCGTTSPNSKSRTNAPSARGGAAVVIASCTAALAASRSSRGFGAS